MNKLLIFVASIFVSFSPHAQQNTVVSGGNATGSNGSVSYTIGQIDYLNAASSNGNRNEGVQQPYEFFQDVGLPENSNAISLYPNPTNDYVILKLENLQENYTYQMTDLQGKIVLKGTIKSTETHLDMTALSTATYQLQIFQQNRLTSSIKIIKN